MARKQRESRRRRGARRERGHPTGSPAAPATASSPAAPLLLALIAFALYANTIPNGYALDDAIAITRNRFTQEGLAGIADLLRNDAMRGMSDDLTGELSGGRYRPLSLVTFAVEQQAFGGNPHVSHALNALLYALCVVVVYRFFQLCLEQAPARRWPFSAAFLAALLFAVHPVHTEVVANIKGRDELLALGLALGSLCLALRAPPVSWRVLLGSALLLLLGLFSKEGVITFLAIGPLTLWVFRPGDRERLRHWLPLGLAAAALFVAIRQTVVASGVRVEELLNDPFLGASTGERLATIAYTQALYAKLLLIPHPLTIDYYPYHVPLVDWLDGRAWLGLLVVLGIAVASAAGLRRRSVVGYGLAFYLLAMSVTSNLLVPVGAFMGERFLFAPSVGACLAAGWALSQAIHRVRSEQARALALAAVALLVVVPFSLLTIARNRVWKDNFTLATTDVETSSDSAFAHGNAARELLIAARGSRDPRQRRDFEARALAHVERALEIHPRYEWALRTLAHLAAERGEIERAIEALERLYDVFPGSAYELGSFLLDRRPERAAEAVRYLETAVARDPDDVDALRNLGVACYRAGDLGCATRSMERAVRLRPADPALNLNLAQLYQAAGDARFAQQRARSEQLGAVFEPLDELRPD